MTSDEFIEAMKALEKEYDYFISMGNIPAAKNIIYEMECLEANYGRGL